MKNEVQRMPIRKIKRMLTMRWMSLLISGLVFVLTIAFLFGKPGLFYRRRTQ